LALETATFISDLVSTNPSGTDQVAQSDDHLRLIKAAIKATFPNITGAVTVTQSQLNAAGGISGNPLGSTTPATDTLPYFTSASTAATTAFTSYGRTLVATANAAAALSALGAQAAGSYAVTSGVNTFTGLQTHNVASDGSNQLAFQSAGTARGYLGSSATYALFVNNAANSTTLLTLDTTGNLTATQNVSAYSDERLKTDIEQIDDALGLLDEVYGVRYTRTDTGARRVGLIAQDVRKSIPEAVLENQDTGLLSVSYGDLVGVLVEAIKELECRIEALEESKYS
jgi:hypothetical protein